MGLYYDKIVLFGDSITQMSFGKGLDFSFAANLLDDYQRRLDIENRGYGGYNSKHAVEILPEILSTQRGQSKIKLLIIFFGTNDSKSSFQGVPLNDYRQNMEKLVQMAQDAEAKTVVIGPGLHDPKMWEIQLKEWGVPIHSDVTSNKKNRAYADAAKDVAKKFNVPFIDMWKRFQEYGKWTEDQLQEEYVPLQELLTDGVHFTGKAYEILYNEVVGAIAQHYPELKPENLKEKLAYFDQIDNNDLRRSIFSTE